MIFPYDVNKVIVNSKKIAGQNKTQLVIVLMIVGSISLFYVVDVFISGAVGAGLGLTILIVTLIMLIVGILAFRFFIFNEDEKKREFEGQESDSFAKYMFLRKDIHTDFNIDDEQISIFEFVNGSSLAVIEFRFGSNDNLKARKTRDIYENIIHIAAINGIEHREVITSEDFRTSEEFRRHIKAINSIKNKAAAQSVMRINDAIIEESCNSCNVDLVYVILRTKSAQQRYDLELVLKSSHNMINSVTSAFRSAKFLNADELMGFFREFYGIEAIDLSMMRAMVDAADDVEEYSNLIALYQIITESNKVFNVDKQYFSTGEQKLN